MRVIDAEQEVVGNCSSSTVHRCINEEKYIAPLLLQTLYPRKQLKHIDNVQKMNYTACDHHHQLLEDTADRRMKVLPRARVVSLAQQLLPNEIQRLDSHQADNNNKNKSIDFEEDEKGVCSPLGTPQKQVFPGSPTMATPQKHKPYKDYKSTGEEESDYRDTKLLDTSDVLERGESFLLDEGEDTAMQYLPKSAALLVSALQQGNNSCCSKKKEKSSTNTTFNNLHSLMMNEEVARRSDDGSPTPIRRTSTLEMESNERVADALLNSILHNQLSSVVCSSSHRASGAANGAYENNYDDEEDDASISMDVARLSQSIAHLQHDLENIDTTQFHGMFDNDDDGFEHDENNSILDRIKLWFSRGMIMEQKLLQAYVNIDDDGGRDDNTIERIDYGRYMIDNQVLVWSVALMWSFVVLIILMHPKISELVVRNPGQLVDFIEWLFS